MFLEVIVNFQKLDFVDPKELNLYQDDEGLETISVKNLETRLEKSFGIQVEKVASIKRKINMVPLGILWQGRPHSPSPIVASDATGT